MRHHPIGRVKPLARRVFCGYVVHVSMTTTFDACLTAEIRATMARQRITQAALALRTGINQSRLSRCLSDRYSLTMQELAAIADALETTAIGLLRAADLHSDGGTITSR